MERKCLSSCIFWKLLNNLLPYINESIRHDTDMKIITSGNVHGELSDKFKTNIHFSLQLIEFIFSPMKDMRSTVETHF